MEPNWLHYLLCKVASELIPAGPSFLICNMEIIFLFRASIPAWDLGASMCASVELASLSD